ncbi:PAS domain-containing protein [Krasilnikovia cinnamomea]|uniref:PAS domain-containing protein n=1 Tax=Krasilnikovia cinnamomea TaxID=349313 RepID=A0A4Q7ZU76_9ACTN|nr:PAS domain-containing protein [Krasilnikovia cinnamomea]
MQRDWGGATTENLSVVPKCQPEFQDRFKSLFEQSGMCMANLDSGLRLREANSDFLRQLDRKPQDSYGRSFLALLHRSVRTTVERELSALVTNQRERFTGHIVATRRDGTLLPGKMTAVAVSDPKGDVDTVLVLVMPSSRQGGAAASASLKVQLRPMDARILEGVAAGDSTVKLASSLFMSRGGVEYRVTALLRLLRVSNRPALISKAHSLGLFNIETWPPKVHPEFVES